MLKRSRPVLALAAIAALTAACASTDSFVAPTATIGASLFGMERSGSPLMYQFETVMQAGPDVTNPNSLLQANHEAFCGKAMLPMMEPGWHQRWKAFQGRSDAQARFSFTYRCKDYWQLNHDRGDVWNTRPTLGQPDLRINAGL